jgi:hypothetical protein
VDPANHFLSWSGADTEEKLEYDSFVCTDFRDFLTIDLNRFSLGGGSLLGAELNH